jgi:glycosyltransferase involved in cell wall biosynthesis
MRLVPLSVCIITLNERDNLPRCLESVAGLAAQIVVVDSGSTDGTRQIARAAGAELHERPFEGMHQQKQFALELAREEWVLSLDADEWLDGRLREEVAAVVNGGGGGGAQATQGASAATVAAYALNRRNEYLGAWIDHCGWSPQWRLRLARRARVRFTGHGPHDEMVADGAVGRLTGRLCHRPYRDLADHVAKINRYTDTSARERHAAGERAGLGQLVLRPPARFLRMYVLRAGFLDGWRGLLVSALGGFYVFLKYAKLRELAREQPPAR